ALARAEDGDSITFANSILGGQILLKGTLVIDDQVYINGMPNGDSAPGITLRPDSESGTFFPMVRVTEHVQGAGAVLQGVTIDGGWGVATESGDWALARVVNGLENNGKLDLADVVFQNLSASAAYTDNLDAIAAISNNGTLHAWNVEVNDSEAEGGMNGG